jgi:hypothetical protein
MRIQVETSNIFLRSLCSSQVGGHDVLGMQLVPLKLLTTYETKEFKLELVKNTNNNSPQNPKKRGHIEVELTFVPFKKDSCKFSEPLDSYERKESGVSRASDNEVEGGAGLLSVIVQGAEDVEGERHNNPYALVLFRGERKKTKVRFLQVVSRSIPSHCPSSCNHIFCSYLNELLHVLVCLDDRKNS